MSDHATRTPPRGIAAAIAETEARLAMLHRCAAIAIGQSTVVTVADLRPITGFLGLHAQPETLRSDMELTLERTAEGWRTR